MKIGFYTSTLGDRPINEVIEWAKQAGFDGIEIDVNRHLGAPGSLSAVAELRRGGNPAPPDAPDGYPSDDLAPRPQT